MYERKRKKKVAKMRSGHRRQSERHSTVETIEIELGVNKNQNRKQAGDSTITKENKMQKENTDQEIVAKAPINISFNFVLK